MKKKCLIIGAVATLVLSIAWCVIKLNDYLSREDFVD